MNRLLSPTLRFALLCLPLLLTCGTEPVTDGSSEIGNPSIKEGLYGYLVDERSGQRAEGAMVRLYAVDNSGVAKLLGKRAAGPVLVDSTSTDSTGLYLFDSIPADTYTVEGQLTDQSDTLYALHANIAFDSLTYAGVDTLYLPGRISGAVGVSQGDRWGITVYVPGTSYIAITDTAGAFMMSGIPPGVYSVSYMGGMYGDTSIGGVRVFADSTTMVPLMQLSVDPSHNARTMWGEFDTNSGWRAIDSIKAYLTGDSIPVDQPWVFALSWRPDYCGYSGFIYTPHSGVFWTATAIVYDTLGHKIGQQSVRFDRTTAIFQVPLFDPANAMPRPSAGNDTVLSINDTIQLHGTAVDSFGGRITKWEWLVKGSGGFAEVSTGDTTIVAPPVPDSNYVCVLRVTDDDSNMTVDTVVAHVVLAPPTAHAGLDTMVTVGDTIRLHGTAADSLGGRIMRWEWLAEADTGFVTASSGEAIVIAPRIPDASYVCVLRVTDDDGNTARDTVGATVLLAPPTAHAGPDTIVSIGDTIRLHGAANDTLGGRIVKWEWLVERDSVFFTTCSGDTVAIAPSRADASYQCVLRVTDDDGNTAVDTCAVNVLLDPPVVSASDTTVSINDAYRIRYSATDRFGRIVRYRIDSDGDGQFEDSSDVAGTALDTAPATAGTVRAMVQAVDDDGNATNDTGIVSVLLDAPSALLVAEHPWALPGDTLGLHATASQRFGTIVGWEWACGDTTAYMRRTSADTSVVVPTVYPDTAYICRARAIDDDGNVSLPAEVRLPMHLPNVTLNLCAEDTAHVYLNGSAVTFPQDSTKASVRLLLGRNVLAVRVDNVGWSAGLCASINLRQIGIPDTLRSDSTWRCTDAASASTGWEQQGFDDSRWEPAGDYGLLADDTGGNAKHAFLNYALDLANLWHQKARWLWTPMTCYFRKSFTRAAAGTGSVLIRGNGFVYRLYLNGVLLCQQDTAYTPAQALTRIDSLAMPSGENVIAVEATCVDSTDFAFLKAGVFMTNPASKASSDSTWKCSWHSAPGWNNAGFDDSQWPYTGITREVYDIHTDYLSGSQWIWPSRMCFRKEFVVRP